MTGVMLRVAVPSGWTAKASTPASFAESIAPGRSVRATFQVTAPARASMGFLAVRAAWNAGADAQTDESRQRARSAPPVKINEVRFATGGNATDQFVELYNASSSAIDLSHWKLVNTRTFFAPVPLATIPAGTKLLPGTHYLLGLSSSGHSAPAAAGATVSMSAALPVSRPARKPPSAAKAVR